MQISQCRGTRQNDGSRHLSLSETDDDVMLRQICASHIIPKGHNIDVKTLFSIIKHVLQSVPCSTDISATSLSSEESSNLLDMTSASSIYNITNKIATSSNRSVGLITKDVCKKLSSYTWYEKVVVSWATYIVNYGEFWLVACLFPSNKQAKSIAKLNYTSKVADDSDFLCQRIEAITNLIQTTLDISKCILEFNELPSQYISPDTPLLSSALSDLIPKASYWAIKSVVACALQVEGLIKINNEFVEYSYDASDVLTQQMTRKCLRKSM